MAQAPMRAPHRSLEIMCLVQYSAVLCLALIQEKQRFFSQTTSGLDYLDLARVSFIISVLSNNHLNFLNFSQTNLFLVL